jgi:hypothetical protein
MKNKIKAIALSIMSLMLITSASFMFIGAGQKNDQIFSTELAAGPTEDYELGAEYLAMLFNETSNITGLNAEIVDGQLIIYANGEPIMMLDNNLGIIPYSEFTAMAYSSWAWQNLRPVVGSSLTSGISVNIVKGWSNLAMIVSFVAGFIVGYLYAVSTIDTTGLDPQEVYLVLREYESEVIFRTTQTASALLSTLLTMDSNMLRLTELYFNRVLEVTAASYWGPGGEYYPEHMILYSGILDYITSYCYNYGVLIEEQIYQFKDVRSGDGTDPGWYTVASGAFDSMVIAFTKDVSNTSYILTPTVKGTFSPGLDSQIYVDAVQAVTPAAGLNRVYLDTALGATFENVAYTIYIMGINTTQTVTIADSNGFKYILHGGINDMRAIKDTTGMHNLKSGWYTLQVGPTYCGPFFTSPTTDGAMVIGGLMLYDSGKFAFAYAYGDRTYRIIDSNGVRTPASQISLNITFAGQSTKEPKRTYLSGYTDADGIWRAGVLDGYRALIDQEANIVINSSEAGRTAWNIYEFLDEQGALTDEQFLNLGIISPSAIAFSNSANLTSEGLMIAYLSALRQISSSMGEIDLSELRFSAESLHTYQYGSIWYNGSMIGENAIFTLVSYNMYDVHVYSSKDLNWDGSGMLIIWQNYLDDYSQWDGTINPDTVVVRDLNNLYKFAIGYIIDDSGGTQQSVNHIVLKADTMERIGLLDLSKYKTKDVTPDDGDGLSTIIKVVITIIVMLALMFICMRVGGGAGILVAFIILIIGSLYILIITGILGDFFRDLMPDWWPFSIRGGL